MNIGLDIDNVISDFDKTILKYFLVEDKQKRNRGIINQNATHINYGMFDWSKEEVDEFYANNMESIALELSLRRGARKIINKLLSDGHKIFLITHRVAPHYKQPLETTLKWLKKRKLSYTKLIFSKSADKSEECFKNNIDIMVDDRVSQCKLMRENGVNILLMLTRFNKKEKEDLPFVRSWEELYMEINKCKR